MADGPRSQPKRRFHKVLVKDDDTDNAQTDGRPPPRTGVDLTLPTNPAPKSGAQTDSKPPPKTTPIMQTEISKVETTQPPKVETTQPPKVETTQPPKVETTQPPKVETTQPPKVETTQPPKVETTQPPKVETTQPPKVETTQSATIGIEPELASAVRSKPAAVSVYDRDMNYDISGGQGMIIVNEKFKKWSNRNGARKDLQYLEEIYEKLNIDCKYKVHKDIQGRTMLQLVRDFSQSIDPECTVIVVSISSHGDKGGTITGTDGESVELAEMIEAFQQKDELLGIPKVFVIQACRGSKSELQYSDTDGDDDDEPPPQYATKSGDTIICYSTGEGYTSFRNTKDGSWFIRILHTCIMESRYRNLHFVEIMTVCCDLAVKEKNKEPNKAAVTQTPSYCSTLRKFIRFQIRDESADK